MRFRLQGGPVAAIIAGAQTSYVASAGAFELPQLLRVQWMGGQHRADPVADEHRA